MIKTNTLLKTECKENTFLENNQIVTPIFVKTINKKMLIIVPLVGANLKIHTKTRLYG